MDLGEIIALGEDLASMLFPPRALSLLIRSRERIGEDEGLRLRLKLDSFALANLPWEYAYRHFTETRPEQKGLEGFLGLNRRISIVRYEVMEQAPGSLDPVGAGPLRMVAFLADPDDPGYDKLRLDVERRHIEEAVEDLADIRPEFFTKATVESLEEALSQDAHVFHFAGHGLFEGNLGVALASVEGTGFIVLLNPDGTADPFPADRLALNLRDRGVRLAVLGACEAGRRDQVNAWTGVVPALTRAGIPAVVGMQYTIHDDNAIAFSRRFYRALAEGQPIDAAMSDGRRAIFNRSRDEERDWGVPVLYLRSEDGVLFPKPRVVEAKSTWDDLLQRCHDQTERFLQQARGTPESRGSFIPEVYVERTAVEGTLEEFLKGEASATILVGDSGFGKTNLLSQWTLRLRSAGHGAFLYDFSGSVGPEIEREIARDLALDDDSDVYHGLNRISELAGSSGRQFVLVFDAINQFRRRSDAGPETLLRRIDALVGRLPDQHVRVVVSCSTPTWRQFERSGATDDLFSSRYFRSNEGGILLQLDRFTAQEFELAYLRYRNHFNLNTELTDLSSAIRERLRNPLLLRMLSEAHWNGSEPITRDALAIEIIQRFYAERVKRRKDRLFVDGLAAEMLRQRRSALAVDELVRQEEFKEEILDEGSDSSYYRLLDNGVLTETSGDLFRGDMVRFLYPRVGAFALARHLSHEPDSQDGHIQKLVLESSEFPLAWDAARTMLVLGQDASAFAELAQSTNNELRELAVEGLVELHDGAPAMATEITQQLLQANPEEARRTGLKAAYVIGSGAREVFLWAAVKGKEELRQAAKDVLYLIWRTDPEFTYGMLGELAERINLGALLDLRNILEFMADLSITIYINHPERKDVVQHTDGLWFEVLKHKLHVDIVRPGLEKLLIQVVARAYSRRILERLFLIDSDPSVSFFSLPSEEKRAFRMAIPLLDPQGDLEPATENLAALLSSGLLPCNVLAAMVLAVHAYRDLRGTEPLLRNLFERLNHRGRLLELAGFTVLLPDAPRDWVGILEAFTRRVVEEDPASFHGEETGLPAELDLVLLPLGVAYGKRGLAMPYLGHLIEDGLQRGDRRQVKRTIAGLGPIGFYYPRSVFHTLRTTIPDFNDAEVAEALVLPLAIMRTLHFDAVDNFLHQIGMAEDFQRRVSTSTDVELVSQYIYLLGLYNNAVHQAVYYPRMRRRLLMSGLEIMADADSAEDFVTRYSTRPLKMLRESDYRLIEWTEPD